MYWSQMESPLGYLTFIVSAKGLCNISFSKNWEQQQWLKGEELEENDAWVSPYMQQVKEYLEGTRKGFSLSLDLPYGTPFQRKVWGGLQAIPYGEVRSYKEIAEKIGSPKAVRAVGGANNKNPIPIIIPCHRVIGANGALVGYGGGLSIKKDLLKREGHYLI